MLAWILIMPVIIKKIWDEWYESREDVKILKKRKIHMDHADLVMWKKDAEFWEELHDENVSDPLYDELDENALNGYFCIAGLYLYHNTGTPCY